MIYLEIEVVTVDPKQAVQDYKDLKQAFRKHHEITKDESYRNLMRALAFMRHSGKIIDVYEAFKTAGVDDDGQPKFGIVRADSRFVLLTHGVNGSAHYWHDRGTGKIPTRWNQLWYGDKHDVMFPEGTFQWKTLKDFPGDPYHHKWGAYCRRQTVVPLIPPAILIDEVKHHLRNYHIIWEVEEWKKVPTPPKDPILAKRISANLFNILATWELTPLERLILKGAVSE